MTFFDPENPNKYSALKKLIVPFYLLNRGRDKSFSRERIGKKDGSYVLANHIGYFTGKSVSLLSYGIGNDPLGVSFEEEFSKLDCAEVNIEMFDGSIDEPPANIPFSNFHKENLTAENFKDHIELIKSHNSDINILKMDIEGHEYDFLTKENMKLVYEYFDQFTIEVHSLIEEIPEGWSLEPQLEKFKQKESEEKKRTFFKLLNDSFNLFHIHANNHAPKYVDFPDSLELTYLSNKISYSFGVSNQRFPIEGLDEPNYDGRPDYRLDYWI